MIINRKQFEEEVTRRVDEMWSREEVKGTLIDLGIGEE